ncbi:TPA: hypothetical protein N0F65_012605 [Lagenidium giganteum]|uniref:TAF1C beta-propeller domain-containing protein n=1 Tax=Lagenidium giganteum TaxID=4803 RepID=A0AAV2YTF3_9STRA|nr:TPA: hypothetical protein N0F65_012605 [Lagenidium giganteum]
MEATRVYPNWPPVLLDVGLAGAVVTPDPDRIPLRPHVANPAIDRPHALVGAGPPQLVVRNVRGYPFLRATPPRVKYFNNAQKADALRYNIELQSSFFRRNYRCYLPSDVLAAHLSDEQRSTKERTPVPRWQGNAICGIAGSDGDALLVMPTGQILQQVCAVRCDLSDPAEPRLTSSDKIELGGVVQQTCVLGRASLLAAAEHSTHYVAARAATVCSVLSTSFGDAAAGSKPSMKAETTIKFPEMLFHAAGSPHAEAEAAFVTADGALYTWTPQDGVQMLSSPSSSTSERLMRCEYSSHPCVLWTADRQCVSVFDVRSGEQAGQRTKLFDLMAMGSHLAEIYSVKRRASNPFEFIVGTSVSLEILDSRMARTPLLSWAQRTDSRAPSLGSFGLIDEVATRNNVTGVLSMYERANAATLFPLVEHTQSHATNPSLTLTPLRSNQDDAEFRPPSTSQYAASNAPLDIPLVNAGEEADLVGLCGLPCSNRDSDRAAIFQLSSLGDLFFQGIRETTGVESFDSAVQLGLRCGYTTTTVESAKHEMPLPVEALLPELEADNLESHTTLPVKPLMRHFPRLNANTTPKHEATSLFDAAPRLLSACSPSITLFRLHRYAVDQLGLAVSPTECLRFVQSYPGFRVQAIRWNPRRPTANVIAPQVKRVEGRDADAHKLDVCMCRPGRLEMPCSSLACVIPHATIISSATDSNIHAVFPANHTESATSLELAAAIESARAKYGSIATRP